MNITIQPTTAQILLIESPNLTKIDTEARLRGHVAQLDTIAPERLNEIVETASRYSLVILDRSLLRASERLRQTVRYSFGHAEIVLFSHGGAETGHNENRDTGRELSFIVTDLDHLVTTVDLAQKHAAMKRELFSLRGQIAMSYGFDNIVGQSDAIRHIKQTLARVAETDIMILLRGAEGSGRSLAAHTLHHHSKRRHQPMVSFDCKVNDTAKHHELIFGQNFGASDTDDSLLQSANLGSLYIKNIENLSVESQARLADFLKTMRLGAGNDTNGSKLDTRFIISTTADLEQEMLENRFNQDLWHQINVLPLRLPSLSERKEDIELLIEYFLRRLSAESGSTSYRVTPAAVESLRNHNWPGEVKELSMTLKRAAAVCNNNEIGVDDLGNIGAQERKSVNVTETLGAVRGRLAEGQKKLIIKALDDNDWNFTQTAQELGIGRTTLWRKIKKYNLARETAGAAE